MTTIAATLHAGGIQVAPGASVSFSVEVRNLGTVVDRYRCELVGVDPSWWTVSPASMELFPERTGRPDQRQGETPPTTGRFTFTFSPPRTPAAIAGPWPIGAKVTSEHDPSQRVVEEGSLAILPFGALVADLRPVVLSGRFGASTTARVTNQGNRPETVTIQGSDVAERIDFKIDPPTATLKPGETVNVRVRLSGGGTKIVGGSATRTFTIEVRAGAYDTAPVSLPGTFEHKAIMSAGVPVALATIAALALGGSAIYFAFLRGNAGPSASPSASLGVGPTASAASTTPSAVPPSAAVSATPKPTPTPITSGWRDWTNVDGGTQMMKGATVTAATRQGTGHVDLFTTDTAGRIVSSSADNGGPWTTWSGVAGGAIVPGTQVTTLVEQAPSTRIDLFVTGQDDRINWNFFDGTWHDWTEIHSETPMAHGATVTAIEPRLGHIDLFTTDPSGFVVSSYSDNGGAWQPWFGISGGQIVPGAMVTPFVESSGRIDLYVTGGDRKVYTTWWQGAGWQGWTQIHPETLMAVGAPLTASGSPGTTHIDLLGTTSGGFIRWSSTDDDLTWQPWTGVDNGRIKAGAPVTALVEPSGRTDIFVTGQDGGVDTNWSDGAWHKWSRIHTRKMQPGAMVGAIEPQVDRIELYVTGPDGKVRTAFWTP